MIRFHHSDNGNEMNFTYTSKPTHTIARIRIDRHPSCLYIRSVYVNPAYRNAGLATKLMLRVIDLVGSSELSLLATPDDNTIPQSKLIKFYRKFGFRVVEKYSNGSAEMRRVAQ